MEPAFLEATRFCFNVKDAVTNNSMVAPLRKTRDRWGMGWGWGASEEKKLDLT